MPSSICWSSSAFAWHRSSYNHKRDLFEASLGQVPFGTGRVNNSPFARQAQGGLLHELDAPVTALRRARNGAETASWGKLTGHAPCKKRG